MNQRIWLWEIPGGVHPPENKAQSVQQPIRPGPLPAMLVVPLQQHIGAPARPVVQIGDHVLKGQKIADAEGAVSAPIHAPSSGTVIAIGSAPVQHPSELESPCITIATDGEDRWIEHTGVVDYTVLERSQVLSMIREAGIVGMGGAGFPSAIKLGIKSGQAIEHLILNAVECEPYITADDMLMRERATEVVAGLKIMAWLVQPQKVLIGIEDNKPEAIAAMKKAAQGTGFEVIVVPTKYPSGGEKQIIQLLTGKEVASGRLPADVGVICQNTGTAYAVANAVLKGEPLISRVTTLTGDAVADKGNFDLLIGTPVKDALQHARFEAGQLHRLVMGGPMMGFTLHDMTVPVVKTTNCLLAASSNEMPDPAPEMPCIRCGACAQACPMSLLPQQLYWFSKSGDHDKAQLYNLFDCIECGACSYVCPSHIPLVQYYRHEKGEIRKLDQEKRKADRARARFDARKAREEREEREKEEKRRQRAQAAADKQKAAKAAAPPASTTAASTVSSAGESVAAVAPVSQAATTLVADTHPLLVIKTAWTTAQKRWKDAEKALHVAEQAGNPKVDIMRDKVEKLRLKAEEARQTYETARASASPAELASADTPSNDSSPNDSANSAPADTSAPVSKSGE